MKQKVKRNILLQIFTLTPFAALISILWMLVVIGQPQWFWDMINPEIHETQAPTHKAKAYITPEVYIAPEAETPITQPPPARQVRWDCKKIDDVTTACAHPEDERMSTPDELFEAINQYRKTHALPLLEKNDMLCNVAQSRANAQNNQNYLSHDGFGNYAQNQDQFRTMGEVLYGGAQNQLGVHIVEWGWARSLTGHKEALEDPKWTAGCGGISGYYAAFIFGMK